jgi:hypothetical protein
MRALKDVVNKTKQTQKMKTVNMCDTVWVKLTEEGTRVLRAYCLKVNELPMQTGNPSEVEKLFQSYSAGESFCFRLWELARIFGEASGNRASPVPFEGNEIYLERP